MADFIERYRPRHEALETLQQIAAEAPLGIAKAFASAFTAVADTSRTRHTNLLDLYLRDSRELLYDSMQRPEHYTARHIDAIERLHNKRAVTDQEKNELFETWQRPTDLEAKSRARLRELTDRRHAEQRQKLEDEETVLENGRTLAEDQSSGDGDSSFENQNFGDKVII